MAIFNAGAAEDLMIVTSATGEPIISSMDSNNPVVPPYRPKGGGSTAYQLWQTQKLRIDTRKEYLNHWEATVSETGTGRPVDVIICPAAAYVAHPHGLGSYANYTMVWNSLDYPATVFPVTTVDPILDAKTSPHEFYGDFDKSIYEMYDNPETFKNAPVCLQLVGRTLEEEAVIRMTEIVCAALESVPN